MIKKFIIFLFLYLIYFQVTNANNYIEIKIDWYKFKIIKYDTKSYDYIFKIWANQNYNASNLMDLMQENNGISAINWVFFCPETYSECWWKNFTKNERYIKWKNLWTEISTWDRVVFAIDEDNYPFLYQTEKINKNDEDKIYYWFSNFPLLLHNWENKFQEYEDLGLIDKKMKDKISRNFVCSDKSKRYIISWFVSDIELEKLPDLLLKIWCYDAINLDAWWSSSLIYNSRYVIWPWRNILDWIIIEKKWLDTSLIIENWKKIQKYIQDKIKNETYEDKIIFLNNLIEWLKKIRIKIYNQYSNDIYIKWEKIWYEIDVTNINKLKTVYIANYLTYLIIELKIKYIKDEVDRVQEERKNNNSKDLLF